MSESGFSRTTIILIVSIVVNALLIGFIAGGGLHQRGGNKSSSPPARLGGIDMVRSLDRAVPEEQRAEVRQHFREVYQRTQPLRKTQRQARLALTKALTAETYDEAAVLEALEAMRAADSALESEVHTEIAGQLGKLSIEQRRALVRGLARRNMERRRDGPPPRRSGGPGRDGPPGDRPLRDGPPPSPPPGED